MGDRYVGALLFNIWILPFTYSWRAHTGVILGYMRNVGGDLFITIDMHFLLVDFSQQVVGNLANREDIIYGVAQMC